LSTSFAGLSRACPQLFPGLSSHLSKDLSTACALLIGGTVSVFSCAKAKKVQTVIDKVPGRQ
jgi:hypothetical protein